MKIQCTTLFDITRTNVNSRRNRLDSDAGVTNIVKQRGQQSNFETLLQVISMRAQPEDIVDPEKLMTLLKDSDWGTEYKNKTKVPVWRFSFTIDREEVFSDGNNHLALLLQDTNGVPMTTNLDEWAEINRVSSALDISDTHRNVIFEVCDGQE